jgi:AcrR family transcriptional regulator
MTVVIGKSRAERCSMASPNPRSRDQLVAGAADMIRRRGLNATSIRDVARHAHAPLG